MDFRKTKNSESGIILFTVIMMIMVLSLVVISFMSSSVGQIKSSQGFVDRIKAEELATGVFYQYHQRHLDNYTNATAPATATLDGKTYQVQSITPATGGIYNTNSITITITY